MASEADRHAWVKAFTAYVRQHRPGGGGGGGGGGGLAGGGLAGADARADGTSLGERSLGERSAGSETALAPLQLGHVRFPTLRGSHLIRLGDGSFMQMDLHLCDGRIDAGAHECLLPV